MEQEYKHFAALYLLNDQFESLPASLLPEDVRIPIAENLGITGFVIQFQDDPHDPTWKDVIDHISSAPITVSSQRPGSLVFLRSNGKAFILSFGMGWRKIELNWIVLNFGKLVALNAIPFDQLSGLKLEQVLSTWHQSIEKSPQPSVASSFGMEYDRDLVHDVEGKPANTYLSLFGAHIKGSDALHFQLDFNNIKNTLDWSVSLYNSSTYKNVWPEFNYMRIITIQSEIDQLDSILNSYLSSIPNDLILACPLSKKIDTEIPSFFWVGRKTKGKAGSSNPLSPYIYLHSWYTFLQGHSSSPSVATSKSTPVHLMNESGHDIAIVRIYDCICFEASLNNKTYFLSGGKWHEADIDFVTEVQNYLPNIQAGKVGTLSSWLMGEPEEIYNIRCCAENNLWLFDQKMVMHGGGQSKFEICDMFDETTNTMYFVKKISGSNNFSHFAEQVRNSIRLIYSPDPTFRNSAIAKIKTAHPTLNFNLLSTRPHIGQIKISLVSMGSGINDFPFFAKLSLMKLHKELDLGGHEVEFHQV